MVNPNIQNERKITSFGGMTLIFIFASVITRYFEKSGWIVFSDSVILCIAIVLLIEFWLRPPSSVPLVNGRVRLIVILSAGCGLTILLRKLLSGLLPNGIVYGLMIFLFATLCLWLYPRNIVLSPREMRATLIRILLIAGLFGLATQVFNF